MICEPEEAGSENAVPCLGRDVTNRLGTVGHTLGGMASMGIFCEERLAYEAVIWPLSSRIAVVSEWYRISREVF